MSFRVFGAATSLLGAALFGCSAGDQAASPRQPAPGRLVLLYGQPSRSPLLDVPASATYCEADSAVAVVAVTRDWVGAVAVRTGWPLADSTRFELRPTIGATGTAALALRPVAESVGRAMVSAAGRLVVVPGARLTGRIEALVSRPGDSARVAGRLENVPVRQSCPSSP